MRENFLVKNEITTLNNGRSYDHPFIGIILCRSKKRAVVEYALRESNKPIGVAAYRIIRRLPAELIGKLPEPIQIKRLLEAVGLPYKTLPSTEKEGV